MNTRFLHTPCLLVASLLGCSTSLFAAEGPTRLPPERVALSVSVAPSANAAVDYEGRVTVTDLDRNLVFGSAVLSFGVAHPARFRANVQPNSVTFLPEPSSVLEPSPSPQPNCPVPAAVSLLIDVSVEPTRTEATFDVTYLLLGRPHAKAVGSVKLK